jgi:hypothetical protein
MPPKRPKSPTQAQPKDGYVNLRIPASDKLLAHLESLGARPDRGGSPWNRSNVLRGQLELFLASLTESDPRSTRKFPQAFYEVTLEVLTEPWLLNARVIRVLPSYVEAQPDFASLLAEAGVDRKAYLKALSELSFAERLFLVESAQMHHAPKPDSTSPDL